MREAKAFGLKAIMVPAVLKTRNLDHPDDGCGLDLIPLVARERKARACLVNSFAFGGQNAALALAAA